MSGPRQHFNQTRRRRDFLVDLVVADLLARTDGMQGRTLRLPTGQTATFARTSTATATDSVAATYTVAPHYPAVQVTSGRAGLLIRPADSPRTVESLSVAYPGSIPPHTGYVRFVDRGAGAVTDARYVQWGTTGNRLIVLRASAGPAVDYDGGSGQQASTGTAHQSSGDLVQLWWRLRSTGTVQLWYQYGAGAVVQRPESAASTVPPVSPASAVITVGSGPTTDTVGGLEVQVLRIHPDPAASLDFMHAGTGL